MMTSFKTQAHIHSLGGAMDEITILDSRQDGAQTVYIVDYKGVKCTAIYNPFCLITFITLSRSISFSEEETNSAIVTGNR